MLWPLSHAEKSKNGYNDDYGPNEPDDVVHNVFSPSNYSAW